MPRSSVDSPSGGSAGVSVVVVLPVNGGVRVADGSVVERSANALTAAFADNVVPPPGEAVVVVVHWVAVHDGPAKIVLAVGMAPDGTYPASSIARGGTSQLMPG